MKVTNHKNGDRSYRFQGADRVHGAPERLQAIKDLIIYSGGPYAWVHDVLHAAQEDDEALLKHPNLLGTDALVLMIKTVLIARQSPHGEGCWDIAERELKEEGWRGRNSSW
jgi:hypothetical protein